MAFITTLTEPQLDAEGRAMYERQRAHYGYVPNYAKVFCHRPEVMGRWARLLSAIKAPMDKRRFELATFAAAHELKSTLCSLAHGRALMEFVPAADVCAIARGERAPSLSDAEAALVEFARRVARDASAVTADDVATLKAHGFDDGEIFDIAAAAAGRAFFSKVIEALGVEADPPMRLAADVESALAAGRPVDFAERPPAAA